MVSEQTFKGYLERVYSTESRVGDADLSETILSTAREAGQIRMFESFELALPSTVSEEELREKAKKFYEIRGYELINDGINLNFRRGTSELCVNVTRWDNSLPALVSVHEKSTQEG